MVIKLDYDGDMRRISMTMSEDSDSAQKLKGIRTAVAQGFGIEESALPALRYKDDEGDLCTLVEASVDDLMQLCKSGTMKLFASKSGSPQDPATECEGAGQSKEVQAEKEESSSEQEAAEQKAMLIKAEEEAKKSTMAQLEVLLKQKEAQAIRRLIQERDEASEESQVATAAAQTSPKEELVAMGFSEEQAAAATEMAKGDVHAAVEYLVTGELPAQARQPTKDCTRMDHAQVFVAQSISALRKQACSILGGERAEKWVTVPSTASCRSTRPGYASEESAAASSPAASSAAPPSTSSAVPTADASVDGFLVEPQAA